MTLFHPANYTEFPNEAREWLDAVSLLSKCLIYDLFDLLRFAMIPIVLKYCDDCVLFIIYTEYITGRLYSPEMNAIIWKRRKALVGMRWSR